MGKNLYRVSQNIVTGYDTYDEMVVCADTSEEARNIHPRGILNYTKDDCFDGSWCKPGKASAELIGLALDHVEKGVVVASFNAG